MDVLISRDLECVLQSVQRTVCTVQFYSAAILFPPYAIINLKCALFSRHYLCICSLHCTHNLRFTDHEKHMKCTILRAWHINHSILFFSFCHFPALPLYLLSLSVASLLSFLSHVFFCCCAIQPQIGKLLTGCIEAESGTKLQQPTNKRRTKKHKLEIIKKKRRPWMWYIVIYIHSNDSFDPFS